MRLRPEPSDASGVRLRTVASVQPRWNAAKTSITSWRLCFRVNGVSQAIPFETEEDANHWRDRFNANGVADGLALMRARLEPEPEVPEPQPDDATTEAPTPVRTIRDVVEACIDDLTGVEPGYIDRCRAGCRLHVKPVAPLTGS